MAELKRNGLTPLKERISGLHIDAGAWLLLIPHVQVNSEKKQGGQKEKQNVQFKEEQNEAWAESEGEEERPNFTWVKTAAFQGKTPPS